MSNEIIMKIISSINLIGALLLAACAKEKEPFDPSYSFEGDWTWWKKSGGIAGIYEDTTTTTDRMSLHFGVDNSYDWKKNDTLLYTGGYSTNIDTSIFSLYPVAFLELDNYPIPQVIKQSGDTLILIENVSDGFTFHFIRKQ